MEVKLKRQPLFTATFLGLTFIYSAEGVGYPTPISKNYVDTSIGGTTVNIDYTANINGTLDARALINNIKFLEDAVEFYRFRDGDIFETREDLIDRFFADRTWRNLNTAGLVIDAFRAQQYSYAQAQRLGRLQRVYDSLPAFWDKGGRGLKALMDIIPALLIDPINLIGLGIGKTVGISSARSANESGKTFIWKNIKSGTKLSAIAQASANGAIGVGANLVQQNRNIEVGNQPSKYFATSSIEAGILRFTYGFSLGGLIGGPAAAFSYKVANR